jgi:hypothetical protein
MKPSVSFDQTVGAWLRRVSATETPPPSIIAFNVGLLQTEDGFSAYLIGAERYDAEDPDWACDESFTPRERYVALPIRRSETKWEQVLEQTAQAVRGFLSSKEGASAFFSKARAITVGFDDGDLVRVK